VFLEFLALKEHKDHKVPHLLLMELMVHLVFKEIQDPHQA
jgi:hypothetical protein